MTGPPEARMSLSEHTTALLHRFSACCSRWQHLILLCALLGLFVLQPLAVTTSRPMLWFDLLLSLVVLAVVFARLRYHVGRFSGLAVGVVVIAVSLASHASTGATSRVTGLAGHSLGVLLLLLASVLIVRGIFIERRLSADGVCGAVCGYLLLGVAWGLLYSMIDIVWPQSFSFSPELAELFQQPRERMQIFIDYSFITLTTVGYGDMTPVAAPARTAAWLEAMAGQFYLAVLVAGLVGAAISRRSQTEQPAAGSSEDAPGSSPSR